MKKAILGKKLGMTQIFAEDGTMLPVTVVQAGPCTVVQKKSMERDGYEAVQVGFGEIRERLVNKPVAGHYKKAGVQVMRYLREMKLDESANMNVGDTIDVSAFEKGDKVDISGTSKGKGFAGSIKRHGSAHHRNSHGGGPVHRSPGSLGACASPGRVFKLTKMPGHMGHESVTVQNLEVIRVDAERNLLLVRGAIPGPKGGLVSVKQSVKSK